MFRKLAVALVVIFVAILPVLAGNGHLLHGIGAINSSMGGAGTGLAMDPIGAVHANPALLTQFDGHFIAVSTEFFVDDLSATTRQGANPPHTTDSDGEPGVLPAVAWAVHKPGSRFAFGWGLLAIAGFRTNWPVDPDSLLLAPQPAGFGRLNTELAVTKVPFALAWKASDKLSLGVSLNGYQNRLIINPLPTVTPDCVPDMPLPVDDQDCFRPYTGVMITEFAFSLQVGLLYQFNDRWGLGFSYTTEQDADPYEWNSEHNNPNITVGDNAFGNPRKISIGIDQPPIASVGLGFRPNDKLRLAFDARWVGYADTDGIGGSGGISPEGALISIGWDDIMVYMAGVEYDATDKVRIRGGLNFNDTPIRDEVALNSGGTPSVFEEHYTFGVSVDVTDRLALDFGTYYTPENSVTGPFIGSGDVVFPNNTITLTNSIFSAQIGFSFRMP